MGCGCFGIVLWVFVLGLFWGGAAWLLANFVSALPTPPWEQAFWFAVIPALVGMGIGAKIGSQSVMDELEQVEDEGGVVIEDKGELATRAGSRAAALGSVVGAAVGGIVFFVTAV